MAMKNHAYSFNGKSYLQEDGGSIGERFTQALARVVMLWWDRQYKKVASEGGVSLLCYKRYVDDVNQASIGLPPGTRWSKEHKKMVLIPDLVVTYGDFRTVY